MPRTKLLPARVVKVSSSDVVQVAEIYHRVLQNIIKVHPSNIELDEEKDVEGIKGTVLRFIERFTGFIVGGKERKWPADEYHLDPQIDKIIEQYVQVLNRLFISDKYKPKACVGEEITDPIILFRELIIRIVYTAFSVDGAVDLSRGLTRLRYIDALEEFINQVVREVPQLSEKNAHIASALSTNKHKDWLATFRDVAHVMDVMYKNKQVINGLLDYLKRQKLIAQMQLLARLNPKLQQEDFDENWLETNLNRTLVKLLPSREPQKSSNTYGLEVALKNNIDFIKKENLQLWLMPEQTKKFLITLIKSPKVYAKNKEFYTKVLLDLCHLIDEINALTNVVEAVDTLVTMTSWVAFVSGVLDFSKFEEVFAIFNAHCARTLSVDDDTEFEFLSSSSGKALIVLNAAAPARSEHITWELNQLNNPLLQEEIKKYIKTSLTKLIDLEQQIGALNYGNDFSIVNQTRLKNMGFALGPALPSIAPALPIAASSTSITKSTSLTLIASRAQRTSSAPTQPALPAPQATGISFTKGTPPSAKRKHALLTSSKLPSYRSIITDLEQTAQKPKAYSKDFFYFLVKFTIQSKGFVLPMHKFSSITIEKILQENIGKVEDGVQLVLPLVINLEDLHYAVLIIKPAIKTMEYFDSRLMVSNQQPSLDLLSSFTQKGKLLAGYQVLMLNNDSYLETAQENSQVHIIHKLKEMYQLPEASSSSSSSSNTSNRFNFKEEQLLQAEQIDELMSHIALLKSLSLNTSNATTHLPTLLNLEDAGLAYHDYNVWYYLGIAYFKEKDIDKALTYFKKIPLYFHQRSIDALTYANCMNYIGYCLVKQEQWQPAIEYFEDCIRFCNSLLDITKNNALKEISKQAFIGLNDAKDKKASPPVQIAANESEEIATSQLNF